MVRSIDRGGFWALGYSSQSDPVLWTNRFVSFGERGARRTSLNQRPVGKLVGGTHLPLRGSCCHEGAMQTLGFLGGASQGLWPRVWHG